MAGPVPEVRPTVSVIIIAHQRRQYLLEAVESVIHQTLSRSAFEVIIVKDFATPELDRYFDQNSIQRVECAPTLSAGGMFVRGIERASGDIFCFLDDDDRFLPTKLAVIVDRFNSRPEIGYIHSQPRNVDASGTPLTLQWTHTHQGHEKRMELLSSREFARAFVHCELGFNNSSQSIRRGVLAPWIGAFSRVRVNCDTFLLLVAMLTETGILCCDQVLNDFRVHESGSSGAFAGGRLAEFYTGRRNYLAKVLQDTDFFLAFSRGTVAEPMLQYFHDYCEALYQFSDPQPHRRPVGRALLRLLENPQQKVMLEGRLPSTVSLATLLLIYLALPASAKWTYYLTKKMTSLHSVKLTSTTA
jgi:glycosyltransferase involved in cell wall biosynthesis